MPCARGDNTGMKILSTLFLITALSVSAQGPQRSTVQATGTGSVAVTPDQAQIDVSAITQAATAQDAASQNATLATNIQAQVAQVLGTSGSVKTINYSVSPNYTVAKDGTTTLT